MGMDKRIVSVLVVAALGLVACGSDSDSPAAGDSLPPVVDGYEYPTGADDVVIEYAEVGGFMPREFAFRQTPNVLISGDGRSFSPGAQIEIYPGPLLPAVQVWSVGEGGIQDALAAADDAGLLQQIDYEQPTNIADASTAQVTINVNGDTYVHSAYALGIGGGLGDDRAAEATPERQALLDFIDELTALASPGPTGDPDIFEPSEFGIEALAVTDISTYGTDGIEPTVVDWPTSVGVRLGDAASCTVVPAAEVGEILTSADQLTFFSDSGITYQVLAKPMLPGTIC